MPVELRVVTLGGAAAWLLYGAVRDLRAGTVVVRGVPVGGTSAQAIAVARGALGVGAAGLAVWLVAWGAP